MPILRLEKIILQKPREEFQVGSEDKNDVLFVGQRLRWYEDKKNGPYIDVAQTRFWQWSEHRKDWKFCLYARDSVVTCRFVLRLRSELNRSLQGKLWPLSFLQSMVRVDVAAKSGDCVCI